VFEARKLDVHEDLLSDALRTELANLTLMREREERLLMALNEATATARDQAQRDTAHPSRSSNPLLPVVGVLIGIIMTALIAYVTSLHGDVSEERQARQKLSLDLKDVVSEQQRYERAVTENAKDGALELCLALKGHWDTNTSACGLPNGATFRARDASKQP
jgi:hypothetical protein